MMKQFTLPTAEKTDEIRTALCREIESYYETYRRKTGTDTQWKSPLIGFAAADAPEIRHLRKIISPTHYMPEDILSGATIVVSYFSGYQEEVGKDNIEGDAPSELWAKTYGDTNAMFLELNSRLKEVIEDWGFHAALPEDYGTIGTLGPDRIYSNWSQRHIAYAAGLGTFGINNMLITLNGTCGRFFSLVTDLPVLPDRPAMRENCIYKRSGKCGACIRRCPIGALSTESPFIREKCYTKLRVHEKTLKEKVCGKCTVGVPCTFRAP